MDTIKLQFNLYFSEDILESTYFKDKVFLPDGRTDHTNRRWHKKRNANGIYTPKYWIKEKYEDYHKKYFVLEFSAPKFLYGENLSMLKQTDFEPLVIKIQNFIHLLGFKRVFKQQIRASVPEVVAIGKNIDLTNLCTTSSALNVLSKFDYKQRAKFRLSNFLDTKNGGKSINFNVAKNETIKFYDKKCEILNNARSKKEKDLKDYLSNIPSEILRFEITYKDKRKIRSKFNKITKLKHLTFKNIFNEVIWEKLMENEINIIYKHPLRNYLLLSNEETPFLLHYIDQYCTQIQVKDTVLGAMTNLQERGLTGMKRHLINKYKSKQTYYNYIVLLQNIENHLNFHQLKKLESYKIHQFVINQFNSKK